MAMFQRCSHEHIKQIDKRSSSSMGINANLSKELNILEVLPVLWPSDEPCLIRGDAKMSSCASLKVPLAMPSYLSSSIIHEVFDGTDIPWQNGAEFVGSSTAIHSTRVVGLLELASSEAVKPKREIQIRFRSNDTFSDMQYKPGDAFYFIIQNGEREVNYILNRLGLLSVADLKCRLFLKEDAKRTAALPKYIPEISSYRYMFTRCLDIRRGPSRPLIRVLADYTRKESERRRLLELCSAQGATEFTSFVREANLSLIDVLSAFPSCNPPVERLIELLPRLLPRSYSVSCIQSLWKERVRFVFSMMRFANIDGRCYSRHGVATDYLASLKIGDELNVMLKTPSPFRMPSSLCANSVDAIRIPLIMIGPGTGVAPFLSFLHYIRHEYQVHGIDCTDGAITRRLYFGCQKLEVDGIYRDEMEAFARDGILSELVLCESNPVGRSDRPNYVQDALKLQGKQVSEFLMKTMFENDFAQIFVCGDIKGMSKDVWNSFIEILVEVCGKSVDDARSFMNGLKTKGLYVEDAWS